MPEDVQCQVTSNSTNAHESEAFLYALQPCLQRLDAFLDAQVNEFEPAVRELVAYTFKHRGKRLRPALVFYAGWNENENHVPEELVRAAAIVELVHLATLVHDDILDAAALRHNSATVAARYGAHSAVLLGDALFAQALILASTFPTTEVCMLVSAATRQVVSGEICQTFLRGDACLSLEQYFRIIRLKTAELFEVSCRLGALLSGGTAGSFPSGSSGSLSAGAGNVAFADAAALFGRHLGIAYQIFDDITDFVGDEARIGKTLGTDLASGKFTLPALLYLQTLPATDANALVKKLADNSVTPAQFVSQMRTAGIPAACSTFLFNELESATGALAPFAGTPAATLLNNLANYVRERFQALNI